jgi:hypothetical protein
VKPSFQGAETAGYRHRREVASLAGHGRHASPQQSECPRFEVEEHRATRCIVFVHAVHLPAVLPELR